MTTRFHDDILNEAADRYGANVDKGTGETQGSVEFYTGSPPANLGDAPGATLLAVADFDTPPSFAAAGSGALDPGVAEANELPLTTTGVDDGEIGWARVIDRDGVARVDEAQVATSGARITVNTTTVSTGVDFSVTGYLVSAVPQSDFD